MGRSLKMWCRHQFYKYDTKLIFRPDYGGQFSFCERQRHVNCKLKFAFITWSFQLVVIYAKMNFASMSVPSVLEPGFNLFFG